MPDELFFLAIGFLICGALVLIMEAFKYYANRSNLYSQERYDKAFKQIIKRELKLEEQRKRHQNMFTNAED